MRSPLQSACLPIEMVLLLTALLLSVAPVALAAQPDAGTLLQEQRQLLPALPDRLPPKEQPETVKAPLTDRGIKVLVRGFRFTGRYEGMASEAELQELVKGSVGKTLGFAELQQLAVRVTNHLREKKGLLLTRAYLPRQDVTDGIVEIAILAGRIDGQVRLDLKEPSRIRPSLLEIGRASCRERV